MNKSHKFGLYYLKKILVLERNLSPSKLKVGYYSDWLAGRETHVNKFVDTKFLAITQGRPCSLVRRTKLLVRPYHLALKTDHPWVVLVTVDLSGLSV